MKVVNVRGLPANDPSVTYCGRAFAGWRESPLRNQHTTHSICKRCPTKQHTREEAIEAFRRDLWEAIQRSDNAVLAALRALAIDATLGCWCSPLPCHCEVIIRAAHWLRNEGQ